MKKILSLTIVLIFVFSLCTGVTVLAENPITVTVDGQSINFDVQPRLIGGRTMVPLRAIFEALGAIVEWDEENQTVTAYNEAYIVKCTIDSNTIYVNNEAKTIDVAPMVIDSRTLVPARFVAEAFNCSVDWDDKALVVSITSNPIDYSEVEQDTKPSISVTPDTTYEPTDSKYYPGTDIPDYTYVTGVTQKRAPYYGDEGGVITYMYSNTKEGEYSEAVDYMGYLLENGWSEYDKTEKVDSTTWYFFKGVKLIGVCFNAKYDEIWITLS